MLKTYTGIIEGDRIRWDDPGDQPTFDQPAKVMVTLLDQPTHPRKLPRSDGTAVADALAEIAARGGLKEFGDPLEWQREVRKDRPIPGREDE